jgi:signal transduction histidine kinase
MIEQIYLAFILMGITIGAVVAALWYQARKASRINLALIRLNEQHSFDTPIFLVEAWPLLMQAGLLGMTWKLDWFGVVKQGRHGQQKGIPMHREIAVAEMKLTISFDQRNNRGEQRYFEETLIETFMLLLRTDMLIKASAIDATFAHMSKLNLFLQHDMKNIAQFIQLMADQLSNIPPGKEQQVLTHLRSAAPLIRHRADRIVRTLTAGSTKDEPLRTIHLREMLQELCELYELEAQIEGDAVIHSAGTVIDTALDNIIKNYHDASTREQVEKPLLVITIKMHTHYVGITIYARNGKSVPALERLFEPFWSSDAAGLGIGLYQAKQMLEMQGGSLQVTQEIDAPLRFQISFPHKT